MQPILSKRCRTLEKEIPQLQEIASKVWKREEELKSLKAELAALDRKIQLELAPQVEKESREENKEATKLTVFLATKPSVNAMISLAMPVLVAPVVATHLAEATHLAAVVTAIAANRSTSTSVAAVSTTF